MTHQHEASRHQAVPAASGKRLLSWAAGREDGNRRVRRYTAACGRGRHGARCQGGGSASGAGAAALAASPRVPSKDEVPSIRRRTVMASVVITSGEQAGSYFPLAHRPLSAGRDPARDIQIIDPKVSRKHFMIRRHEDHYVLVPFKSLNGVHVNGTQIEAEVVLNDLDKITVGDTTLQFQATDDADRTSALDKFKKATPDLREERTIYEKP
ncbi:MAG: FHA domain-containing protein [Phycisphaerales bacterium]|nr:MAG: FHA domain-containing protein [Phycisphaerales bacterium]